MPIEKELPIHLKIEGEPYTNLPNSVIQNIHHLYALAIYTYLASKPFDWKIYNSELEKHFNVGRRPIESGLKHLEELGLFEKVAIRNEKGQIKKWEGTLYKYFPKDKAPDVRKRCSGENSQMYVSPHVDNPQCGKCTTTNKRVLQNKDSIKNKEGGESPETTNSSHKSEPTPPPENTPLNNLINNKNNLDAKPVLKGKIEKQAYDDQDAIDVFEKRFSNFDVTYRGMFIECQKIYHKKPKKVTLEIWRNFVRTQGLHKYSFKTTSSGIPTNQRKGWHKNVDNTHRHVDDDKKTQHKIQSIVASQKIADNSKLGGVYKDLKKAGVTTRSHMGEFMKAIKERSLTDKEKEALKRANLL